MSCSLWNLIISSVNLLEVSGSLLLCRTLPKCKDTGSCWLYPFFHQFRLTRLSSSFSCDLWVVFSFAVEQKPCGEWIWWLKKVMLSMSWCNWVVFCKRKSTFLNNWMDKTLWKGQCAQLLYLLGERVNKTSWFSLQEVFQNICCLSEIKIMTCRKGVSASQKKRKALLLKFGRWKSNWQRLRPVIWLVRGVWSVYRSCIWNTSCNHSVSLQTAQALIQAPAEKSKRHQNKPKWLKDITCVLKIAGMFVFIFIMIVCPFCFS